MAEFILKHGPRSELPSSLPEGDHFIVTSDGGNPVSPPELYIGPDGGGTPVRVGGWRTGTSVPGSLNEGQAFLDISQTPPTLYVGPDGGGAPEKISAEYDPSAVDISGGEIDGVTIGNSNPSDGFFSTLTYNASFYKGIEYIYDDESKDFSENLWGSGLFIVAWGEDIAKGGVALILYSYDGSTPSLTLVSSEGSNSFTTQAGTPLNGTTGPDGSINISYVAGNSISNGKLQIENRSGEGYTFRYNDI